METTFQVRSLVSKTKMFFSFGPTLSQGEFIYGSVQVGDQILPPMPYRWNEIKRFFEQGDLIAESTISFAEMKKYCGNANEAIAYIEGQYLCLSCYPQQHGYKTIQPFQFIPKEEEHYCDRCILT